MSSENIEVRLSLNASGFTSGVDQAKRSVSDLGGELTRIKSVAAGALAFSGIGVGVGELVRIADQYAQITSRLRLATRATGDFSEVQASLRQAAQDTRAPLQDTVNLYSQIAPSLAAVGISSQRTVGIITTVNQAIALSGASTEAAGAALVQFTQGLASGALRGEELNSILEQTPALADAIAKGLGVTRGQLRALGAEGKLTAEVVAKALETVSGSIASDFKDVPLTVGQSMVLLRNSFAQFIGSVDQGTGATVALASGISTVGQGLDDLASSTETTKPLVDVLIDSVDILSRFVRALGRTAGATALILKQLFNGNFQQAAETYKQLWRDVIEISTDPLASNKVDSKLAQRAGQDRIQIETDLAAKRAELEKLQAVAAGNASAEILKIDTSLADARLKLAEENAKARLKGEEALADALRKASEQSLVDAQKARDQAKDLRTAATDARGSANDKAQERRNRDLTDQQRSDLAERDASTLGARATLAAGAAQAAVREGDLTRATKLAEDAAKLAAKAEKAADNILNNDTAASALEEVGRIQEKVLNAQADIKDREASDLEQRASQQNQLLAEAETRIAAIRAELEKPITLQADIAQAEQQIKTLQSQLEALTAQEYRAKIALETTGTVPDGATVALPGKSSGGYTGPGGKFQPAGIVHAGEFVLRSEVTNQPGVLEFMTRLNRDGVGALRGYATGGLVRNFQQPSVSPLNRSAENSRTPIVLDLGDRGRFETFAKQAVAESLERQLRIEAMKAGRR